MDDVMQFLRTHGYMILPMLRRNFPDRDIFDLCQCLVRYSEEQRLAQGIQLVADVMDGLLQKS